MLEGTAGTGKSCVLAQVLARLSVQEVPHLVVRLDRLHEAHLSAPGIGASLGLPVSPTITLGEFAGGQPCVLCIDQLDALSNVSARQQTIWGPFNEMLNEAERYPNMRLLFACRTFDLEQDPRLRKLVTPRERIQRVRIEPLDEATIHEATEASGMIAVTLTDDQIEVLSTPLHLFMFLEASRDGPVDFAEAGDLFDAFWQYKQRSIDERLGRPGAWVSAVSTICDALSERESLATPRYLVDSQAGVLEAMASEAVVQIRDDLVRFFHESFFDYAFARTFLRSNDDLVSWLVSDTQHLFRRSQVRQILSFLRSREQDRRRYLQTLAELLGTFSIRFHIKKLVLAWLSELPDPTDAEWRIVEGLGPELGWHSWSVARNRVPWFDLLHESGRWAVWLDADDSRVDDTVTLLGSPDVLDARAAKVVSLVSRYRGQSDAWRNRLRWLAIAGRGYGAPEMQNLVVDLVSDGTLDDARHGTAMNDDWWLIWNSAARKEPEFVSRLFGAWFDRQLERADGPEHDNPFLEAQQLAPYSQFSLEVISECSSRAPLEFVREFLPRFAEQERQVPTNLISAPSDLGDPEEQLRDALVRAMASLARDRPDELDSVMTDVTIPESKWSSSLLVQAWSGNPGVYADQIAQFLLERPNQRLNIGFDISFSSADAVLVVSRTAIAAASACCSEKSLCDLVAAIVHFVPDQELGTEHVGFAELALLGAFSEERLPELARRRIRQLEQRFPAAPDRGVPSPPTSSPHVSMVRPPIPEESQRRMTDDEWLAAMTLYECDTETVQGDTIVGGAVELAHGLQAEVAQDPGRFARLANRMHERTNPVYFEAILRGLTGSEGNGRPGTLLQVCAVLRRIVTTAAGVEGAQMAHAIRTLAGEEIPDDILDQLRRIAIHNSDPETDEWQDRCPPTDPMQQAVNSARGAAAHAMSRILFSDCNRWSYFRSTVARLVRDPVLAVRTATVPCLTAVLDDYRGDALAYFGKLVDGGEAILGARPLVQFVHYAMFRDYHGIRPVLQRMLQSPESEVAVAGATQLAIAALSVDEASDDLDHLVRLSDEARTGVAKICAANLADEALKEECERRLRTFFADDSTAVRSAARRCWTFLNPDQIAKRGPLIGVFAQTLLPEDEVSVLVHKLQEAQAPLPAELCDLVEQAVVAFGDRASSIRFREGGNAHELSQLMVRLYEETNDDAVKTRALDAIDDMVRAGFMGIDDRLHDRYHR